MPVPGGHGPRFFYKLYRSSVVGVPLVVLILLAGLAVWVVVSRTVFYRHLYAVGGDERSAFASGIKVSRVRLLAHVFAGFFVGLGGMCLLMLTAAGEYRSGTACSLNSIAAVVIGGFALSGGRGEHLGRHHRGVHPRPSEQHRVLCEHPLVLPELLPWHDRHHLPQPGDADAPAGAQAPVVVDVARRVSLYTPSVFSFIRAL
jgi:hypothetical protein